MFYLYNVKLSKIYKSNNIGYELPSFRLTAELMLSTWRYISIVLSSYLKWCLVKLETFVKKVRQEGVRYY